MPRAIYIHIYIPKPSRNAEAAVQHHASAAAPPARSGVLRPRAMARPPERTGAGATSPRPNKAGGRRAAAGSRAKRGLNRAAGGGGVLHVSGRRRQPARPTHSGGIDCGSACPHAPESVARLGAIMNNKQ